MGKVRPFSEKACLITGLLFNNASILSKATSLLQELYGPVLFGSSHQPWSHSEYYTDEIGKDILRTFLCFDRIIPPETIVDIKLKTNEIEKNLSQDGKRSVNIDPGYITPSKVVLASTKNYSHRIYLGKGIYAEVTLYYHGGKYHVMPFTYYDYTKSEHLDFFKRVREHVKALSTPLS